MRHFMTVCILIVICFLLPSCSSKPSTEEIQKLIELNSELESLRTDISSAMDESKKYDGGLLKALIDSRVEILRTTEALMEQRIAALESGAKITVNVGATEPDKELAQEVQKEIDAQLEELNTARQEAAKQSASLVGAMKMATVATKEFTVATLQLKYYASKYGLPVKFELDESDLGVPAANKDRNTDNEYLEQANAMADAVRSAIIRYSSARLDGAAPTEISQLHKINPDIAPNVNDMKLTIAGKILTIDHLKIEEKTKAQVNLETAQVTPAKLDN